MKMFFNEEITKEEAQKYAKRLERIKLSAFIKNIEVEEWKELYGGEKLLVHGERKRFYKIDIKYEKEDLIEE